MFAYVVNSNLISLKLLIEKFLITMTKVEIFLVLLLVMAGAYFLNLAEFRTIVDNSLIYPNPLVGGVTPLNGPQSGSNVPSIVLIVLISGTGLYVLRSRLALMRHD